MSKGKKLLKKGGQTFFKKIIEKEAKMEEKIFLKKLKEKGKKLRKK